MSVLFVSNQKTTSRRWLVTAKSIGVLPFLSWSVCNGESDSDVHVLYSSSIILLNSRWPFEHDQWNAVMPSLSGDKINAFLSDKFNDFKRTEAISVLPFAAAWWSTLSLFLFRVFIQSGSMLTSQLTMSRWWLITAAARVVFPSLSGTICNGGSISDLQFLYSSNNHWLNSRWPFEHETWNAVLLSLSGDKINELLYNEFIDFKRTEAISVSPFAAEWWSTLSCFLFRVFIQSRSMLNNHLTMTSCWLNTAFARGESPSLSWTICNGGSDSDLQFLYSSNNHWLNSRWPCKHDHWNAVSPFLSGDKIKELLSDEFNNFKRTEAISVSPFTAAWWSTLFCSLFRVFIQSRSMLTSQITMSSCWLNTAIARGVFPSFSWTICNGGSFSNLQFLYSWINHWLNSRWPCEHEKWSSVLPSLSGDKINDFLSDEFIDFRRKEAISVSPLCIAWWSTLFCSLFRVFIQSGSMLTSQITMSSCWLTTAIARGVSPSLSWTICNGGSDSDLQSLYSWISHWLNSRWPFEQDQ